jgi:hypothetical protein
MQAQQSDTVSLKAKEVRKYTPEFAVALINRQNKYEALGWKTRLWVR